jgi:hypothetical protein
LEYRSEREIYYTAYMMKSSRIIHMIKNINIIKERGILLTELDNQSKVSKVRE